VAARGGKEGGFSSRNPRECRRHSACTSLGLARHASSSTFPPASCASADVAGASGASQRSMQPTFRQCSAVEGIGFHLAFGRAGVRGTQTASQEAHLFETRNPLSAARQKIFALPDQLMETRWGLPEVATAILLIKHRPANDHKLQGGGMGLFATMVGAEIKNTRGSIKAGAAANFRRIAAPLIRPAMLPRHPRHAASTTRAEISQADYCSIRSRPRSKEKIGSTKTQQHRGRAGPRWSLREPQQEMLAPENLGAGWDYTGPLRVPAGCCLLQRMLRVEDFHLSKESDRSRLLKPTAIMVSGSRSRQPEPHAG
jgi:hypothetical protein